MTLVSICEKPFELIEERIESTGLDRGREYRARKTLEKLGMIEFGGKVGAKWQLYIPTDKGVMWAQNLGLPVYRYKGNIAHELMVRKVRENLEFFSPDITFVAEGESIGIVGIQPDIVARIKTSGGQTSRRVAIQINSSNKADYEARMAVELVKIEQIDLVVLVAKNKRASSAIESRLGKHKKGSKTSSNINSSINSAIISKIRVLDFDTCISPQFDWSWIFND